MEKVILEEISLSSTELGTRVDYKYKAPEILQRYIKGEPLFVEFPCDMKSVPLSILSIPFVGIMATVTMLLNVEIHVPALEKSFMDCIVKLSKVYEKMYPDSGLKIDVFADNVAKSKICSGGGGTSNALFFTGGVDATSALIGLLEKRPTLVNIWGGDLRLTDEASHRELEQYLDTITEYLNLDYCFIKTNAREMFCENELGFLCEELLGHQRNHGWWASIAHVLSMTSASIPWTWKEHISVVYIGSSFDGQIKTLDANNDEMVECLKWCSCEICMADSATPRNEKINRIVEFRKKSLVPIELKVCWNRKSGENCSACEKCYRTMMSIIANKADPNDFGFHMDENTMVAIKEYLHINTVNLGFWKNIQDAFVKEADFWRRDPRFAWFVDFKINNVVVYIRKLCKRIKGVGVKFQ